MSMIDKIKGMLKGREETVRKGVGKAGDTIDRKTGNKYSGQVDAAQRKINERLGGESRPKTRRRDEGTQPPA
jgi:hypothetical protein